MQGCSNPKHSGIRRMYKKILPITEHTNVRTYTYYSYVDAILANESRAGREAAKIWVSSQENKTWSYLSDTMKKEQNAETITFFANKYCFDMNARLFRKLERKDEIVCRIVHQQYSQAWGNISLFVAPLEDFSIKSSLEIQFGNFNKSGIFYKNEYGNIVWDNRHVQEEDRLFLRCEDSRISFWLNEEKIFEYQLDALGHKKWVIGIAIDLFDNKYYDWFFSNFIQWKYNKNVREIKFEFDVGIRRAWNYCTVNQFLLFRNNSIGQLRYFGIDIIDYLIREIKEERYLELFLDSYDIVGSIQERKHHFIHQSLIYGYDNEKEEIYVLYTNQGKPKLGIIPYDSLRNQIKKCSDDEMLVSYEYSPEGDEVTISRKLIVEQLECYIDGKPIMHFDMILTSDDYYYGLDVYDLWKQEQEQEIFLNDERIPYLFYEHKKCMVERLDYMNMKGMISNDFVEQYMTEFRECEKEANMVLNYLMKYSRRPSEALKDKIFEKVFYVEKIEKRVYPKLVEQLKEEMRQTIS